MDSHLDIFWLSIISPICCTRCYSSLTHASVSPFIFKVQFGKPRTSGTKNPREPSLTQWAEDTPYDMVESLTMFSTPNTFWINKDQRSGNCMPWWYALGRPFGCGYYYYHLPPNRHLPTFWHSKYSRIVTDRHTAGFKLQPRVPEWVCRRVNNWWKTVVTWSILCQANRPWDVLDNDGLGKVKIAGKENTHAGIELMTAKSRKWNTNQ